jgi:hypothetical protein
MDDIVKPPGNSGVAQRIATETPVCQTRDIDLPSQSMMHKGQITPQNPTRMASEI